MIAVKGKFDGKKVLLADVPTTRECHVIVIFADEAEVDSESGLWQKTQESVFEKACSNQDDAVYNKL